MGVSPLPLAENIALLSLGGGGNVRWKTSKSLFLVCVPQASRRSAPRPQAPAHFQPTIVPPRHAVFGSDGQLLSLSSESQKLVCSVLGLTLKLSLVVVTGVSLMRLAVAYQERMERQGELKAVLDLETGKLTKARDRFDQLFAVGGEQGLIREQNQWIAPNRLRVVWQPQR